MAAGMEERGRVCSVATNSAAPRGPSCALQLPPGFAKLVLSPLRGKYLNEKKGMCLQLRGKERRYNLRIPLLFCFEIITILKVS